MVRESRGTRRRRRRRLLRRIAAAVVLVFTMLLITSVNVWTLLNPAQLRTHVTALLESRIAYPFTVGEVSYSLSQGLRLQDLLIQSPPGSSYPNILEIPEIRVDLDLFDLWRGEMPVVAIDVVDPNLFVSLAEDSSVPLSGLLRPASGPAHDFILPAVDVANLCIHTCPETLFLLEKPVRVESFRLELFDGRRYEFDGAANSPMFRRVHLSGTGKRLARTFEGRLEISRLRLDESVSNSLPPQLAQIWQSYSPRGVASAVLDFTIFEGTLVNWRARLDIIEAALTLSDPPLELESVSGGLEFSPRITAGPSGVLGMDGGGLQVRTVEKLRGLAWGGTAELSGNIELAGRNMIANPLRLRLEHVPLDRRLLRIFEESSLAGIASLGARGKVSIELDIKGTGAGAVQVQSVELENVSLRPSRFPYPLDNLNGGLTRQGDRYEVDLRGGTELTPIRVLGVGSYGESTPLQLQIEIQNLALDGTLERALPLKMQRVWQSYQPGGFADLQVSLAREAGNPNALLVVRLNPTRARLNYSRFPYEISDVSGSIQLEARCRLFGDSEFQPEVLRFSGLQGRHAGTEITVAAGDYRFPRPGFPHGRLDLPIRSRALEIDPDLVAALPPGAAEFVGSLGIEGALDCLVRIHHLEKPGQPGSAGAINLTVHARVRSPVTVRYQELPFPLTFVGGQATFSLADGATHFQDFVTESVHGAQIRVQGSLTEQPEDERKHLSLAIEVTPGKQMPGLHLDDEVLVAALPEDVRKLISSVDLGGFLTGRLDVAYSYAVDPLGRKVDCAARYQGELDIVDGRATLGVKISDVNAKSTIYGSCGPHPHFFIVDVPRGRYRCSRFQVRDVQAQLYYGREHPLVRWTRDGDDVSEEFGLDPAFVTRLDPTQVDRTLQIYVADARLYGGPTRGFLFVDSGKRGDYMGHFVTEGVDLSVGATDLFPHKIMAGETEYEGSERDPQDGQAGVQGIKGTGEGFLRFSGDINRADSLEGNGVLAIRDGRLQQLPLAAVFLTNPLLGVFQSLSPEQRQVREVLARFSIRGDRFIIPRFQDLLLRTGVGDLLGRGWMDFDTQIHIILEPQGAFYGVPGVTQFLGGLFRQLVSGTLDKPVLRLSPWGK